MAKRRKARDRESTSLSKLTKRLEEQAAQPPTLREWLEWTRQAEPIRTQKSAAQVIREMRDSRSRSWPPRWKSKPS